jgi:hypothetical protein
MPWEHWVGDEDERASAWVRATASNGEDAYEGRVAWSPELGFGLRPPEGLEGGDGGAARPAGESNPAPMERIGRRAKAKRGER